MCVSTPPSTCAGAMLHPAAVVPGHCCHTSCHRRLSSQRRCLPCQALHLCRHSRPQVPWISCRRPAGPRVYECASSCDGCANDDMLTCGCYACVCGKGFGLLGSIGALASRHRRERLGYTARQCMAGTLSYAWWWEGGKASLGRGFLHQLGGCQLPSTAALSEALAVPTYGRACSSSLPGYMVTGARWGVPGVQTRSCAPCSPAVGAWGSLSWHTGMRRLLGGFL